MMSGGGQSGATRSGRARRRNSHQEEVALQITSMADIFTILLVFLLKSYSVSAIDINPPKGLKLPVARGGNERVEALKVEIKEDAISIEGTVVVQLKNFVPGNSEVNSDGSLRAVMDILDKEKKKQRNVANAMGKEKDDKDEADDPDRKLLVVADKRVPYKLMKMVLSSASNQDFTDFKLVVISEE